MRPFLRCARWLARKPAAALGATVAVTATALVTAGFALAAGGDEDWEPRAGVSAARVQVVEEGTPASTSTTQAVSATLAPTTAPNPTASTSTAPPPPDAAAASSGLTGTGDPAPTVPAAPSPGPQPEPVPTPPTTEPATPPLVAPDGPKCLVRLHGKGGDGGSAHVAGDVVVLAPSGNAHAWGGKEWRYFPPASYDAARASVVHVIESSGCGRVIINGFSNGGAFAVKVYCRGETFGGRLVGVVADDPVPDHGADGCRRPAVPLTIYWTGALAATALPGWDCTIEDWTCDGGSTVGIDAYATNAGATVKASPYPTHTWYMNAPELSNW